MSKIKLSENFIKDRVKLALTEDLYPYGDITSNLINNNKIIEHQNKIDEQATLKASTKAKLIAGEKLTEEEANILVGV